jgi:hypothetical protein
MRKFAIILAVNLIVAASFVMYRAHHRSTEMTAQMGVITIRATDPLNETISIFDADPHADVLSDLATIREHAAAYRKLGFDRVVITTLHDSLDRSL